MLLTIVVLNTKPFCYSVSFNDTSNYSIVKLSNFQAIESTWLTWLSETEIDSGMQTLKTM